MIKSIKPGRLAGLSEDAISDVLSKHMNCPVDYESGVAKIRCVDDYEEVDKNGVYTYAKLERAMRLLHKVGHVCISCDHVGPFVKLTFNEIAMDVISGERAKRESAKHKTDSNTEVVI